MIETIAFISFYPMSTLGGGETYTINALRSAARAGKACTLFAPVRQLAEVADRERRYAGQFVELVQDSALSKGGALWSWGEVLQRLRDFDCVWVHQYLSSDSVVDVMLSCDSSKPLLMTSHGHEPLAAFFQDTYQRISSHRFLEVSRYSASRFDWLRGERSPWLSGGIWSESLRSRPVADRSGPGLRLLCVGRILPHKGIEHTIRAMGDKDQLTIVGRVGSEGYAQFLRNEAKGRAVTFAGALDPQALAEALRGADLLVASSTTQLHDGRVLDQAELLGLVILEAVAAGLPVCTSSLAPFEEVMGDMGMEAFVYEEADSRSLARVLSTVRGTDPKAMAGAVRHAQERLRASYCWDDYWARAEGRLEEAPR